MTIRMFSIQKFKSGHLPGWVSNVCSVFDACSSPGKAVSFVVFALDSTRWFVARAEAHATRVVAHHSQLTKTDGVGAMMATLEEILKLDSKSQVSNPRKLLKTRPC
jgi:hypothetical protein